jgi:hypothetical protein
MISKLRPLDLELSFEDRTYRLGDSIDLEIELTPRRDCLVREGRVDLVVEARWTERSTRRVEKPIYAETGGGMSSACVHRIQIGTKVETKESVRDFREKSWHASVVFLKDVSLRSGRLSRHRLPLDIATDDPPRREAKTRWWLQVVIDVAGARDIKPRHKIDVSV